MESKHVQLTPKYTFIKQNNKNGDNQLQKA